MALITHAYITSTADTTPPSREAKLPEPASEGIDRSEVIFRDTVEQRDWTFGEIYDLKEAEKGRLRTQRPDVWKAYRGRLFRPVVFGPGSDRQRAASLVDPKEAINDKLRSFLDEGTAIIDGLLTATPPPLVGSVPYTLRVKAWASQVSAYLLMVAPKEAKNFRDEPASSLLEYMQSRIRELTEICDRLNRKQ